MNNVLKNKIEIKELFKRQAITLIWALIYFIVLTIIIRMQIQVEDGKLIYSTFEKYSIKNFSAIFMGFFSTLYLNSKFEEKNLKNNFIKFIISLFLAGLVYFLAEYGYYESVIYAERYMAAILMIFLAYYYIELKKGKIFKELAIRTLMYISYSFITFILIVFLQLSTFNLFRTSITKDILVYLYSLIPIVFFILFQEDKKEYKLDGDLLGKIFIFFLATLIILMYVNIFMYGRARFYIITHFIFWTGYIIFFINIAMKKKKLALIMLPLNLFLIYKITDRIKDLGLTEGRYFIFFFGLLLLIMYIIQIVKPNFDEKKYMFLILFFSFVAIFIPKINAFNMSRANLSKKANALASKLEEQLANNEKLSYEDREKIANYYYYFKDRDYEDKFIDFVEENRNIFLALYEGDNYEQDKNKEILSINYDNNNFFDKLETTGIDVKGYEKMYYKYIAAPPANPSDNEEDYKLLEEIFNKNTDVIEHENEKIFVQYAYIIKDKTTNTFEGHAQIYILKK